MKIKRLLSPLVTAFTFNLAIAQGSGDTFPLEHFDHAVQMVSSGIFRQTTRYLEHLERLEKKMAAKLSKRSGQNVQSVFDKIDKNYDDYRKLISDSTFKLPVMRTTYLPQVDSIATVLKILGSRAILPNASFRSQVAEMDQHIQQLQSLFDRSTRLKELLIIRSGELTRKLQAPGLTRHLNKFNQQVVFYQSQLAEYKRLLKEPDKMSAKLLNILRQQPVFTAFFKKYSALAALLPPDDPLMSAANITGSFQVRSAVQTGIKQTMGSVVNVNQLLDQQASLIKSQLEALKNKVQKPGQGQSNEELRNYKPNSQRVKTFLQRLELGTNLQNSRSNQYFPSTSDFGLSVGYRLNDKSSLGIGASYKMGWGKDIHHIVISNEGVGLRSYVDILLKETWHLAGGFEYNYQVPFAGFASLPGVDYWQPGGLIGLSKVMSLQNKLFSKTNLQLLLDVFAAEHQPRTQLIKFRIGYSIK